MLAVYTVHLQLINTDTVTKRKHSYYITVISMSAKSTSMTGVPKAAKDRQVSAAVFVGLHIFLPLTVLQKNCPQNI